MADLTNVVRAFEWIRIYHRDLAKLFQETQGQLTAAGCQCLTVDAVDNIQGKKLDRSDSWAPTFAYQFFTPAGRPDVALVILAVAHGAEVDEPYLVLASFTAPRMSERTRDITYRWVEEGASDQPNTEVESQFQQDVTVRHRWMPIAAISGLSDVKTLIVDVLLGLVRPPVVAPTVAV